MEIITVDRLEASCISGRCPPVVWPTQWRAGGYCLHPRGRRFWGTGSQEPKNACIDNLPWQAKIAAKCKGIVAQVFATSNRLKERLRWPGLKQLLRGDLNCIADSSLLDWLTGTGSTPERCAQPLSSQGPAGQTWYPAISRHAREENTALQRRTAQ